MNDEKIIAVKVYSFPKKKKARRVSDTELEKFEKQLARRSDDLCEAVRASERLSAEDYGTRVYA